MKYLCSVFLLLLLTLPVVAQFVNISNPYVVRWDENNCRVTKVEVTKKHTVVSFEHTSTSSNSWVTLYNGIYLQSTTDDSRYAFVKAENIPIKPEKHYYKEAGEVLAFKVYFEKLQPQVKSFDIIERAGATNYFNFFGVSLEKTQPVVARQDRPRVVDGTVVPDVVVDVATHEPSDAISFMLPMYKQVFSATMAAQMEYFNKPGTLAEIAKINKSYYDALVKEGFSPEQALKIITEKPLMQNSPAEK